MKSPSQSDFLRLEKKINLLNDKLDRFMEAQGIELEKSPDIEAKEDEKKRKARERQQTKILEKENSRKRMEQFKADINLKFSIGYKLQHQFNLLHVPSAERIRQFQRTNNASAFDGLKRKN